MSGPFGDASFAELLVRLRTERGLSQDQLATSAAVSVRTIGDLERGATQRPQRETVQALADGLGLTGEARAALSRAARRTSSVWRRASPAATSLPPSPPLIGREADVAGVAGLLSRSGVRLVTVTGPPGVGKSAVALEVAWRVAGSFDAVAFLDLAVAGHAERVTSAMAAWADSTAATESRRARRLLLLDDFSQGESDAAELAGLLARQPRLRVLVSAREPVRLRSEHRWPLSPLTDADALALLIERTRAVRPGFDVSAGQAEAATALCRRLAGVPLAIELAAARLRTREPAALDAELSRTPPKEGAWSPAEALRRMIVASVGLLTRDDVVRLATLARLSGPVTPPTLQRALAGSGYPTTYLDASIATLVGTGLVRVEHRSGAAHLVLAQPVREVAARWLDAPAAKRRSGGQRARKQPPAGAHGAAFGDYLIRLRQSRALSQEELATATGVSTRTISNLERDATRPRPSTVRALAAGLKLDESEAQALERVAATTAAPAASTGSLPAPATSIIGRTSEVATLARLLSRAPSRMVTVAGPGGVGKSRLALEVAWRVADTFERVDAVDVSPLRDRDEVTAALAMTVGAAGPASLASVSAQVGERSWLLLLDSVEHVPDLTVEVADLLDRCPKLRVLATSRVAEDDAALSLQPLPLPAPADTVSDVVANPAVRLLTERIRAVRPGFEVTDANLTAVVTLCRRLDGLPLAIELAATHAGSRDLVDIEAELTATALRAETIDIPGRHRTLRATVEWSTDRLTERDRTRFAVLGAFRGRVAVSAWDRVLRGSGLAADQLDRTVDQLAAVSLVALSGQEGEARVVLLDTIREVAQDLLAESGVELRCRKAHAGFMLDLVRGGDAEALDADIDNVRAALAYAVANDPDLVDAAAVRALAQYLNVRGRFGEAHRLLMSIADAISDPATRVLARVAAGVAANLHGDANAALTIAAQAMRECDVDTVGVENRLAALNLTGAAHKELGQLDRASQAYEQCLTVAEARGESRYVTVALNNLGTVAHERGAYQEAMRHYERSLRIKRDLAEPRGIATALVNLGGLHKDLGDHTRAHEHLVAATERFRDLGDEYATAFALALLGETYVSMGKLAEAERSAREAATLSTGIGHAATRAMAELSLGDVARAERDYATAARHYREALAHLNEPFERARTLERIACVTAESAPTEAVALLAQATDIRRLRGYAVPPVDRAMAEATRCRLSIPTTVCGGPR